MLFIFFSKLTTLVVLRDTVYTYVAKLLKRYIFIYLDQYFSLFCSELLSFINCKVECASHTVYLAPYGFHLNGEDMQFSLLHCLAEDLRKLSSAAIECSLPKNRIVILYISKSNYYSLMNTCVLFFYNCRNENETEMKTT